MKKALLSLALLMASLGAGAVPASQRPFSYIQPDGKSFVLTLVGDEHAHTYMDSEGFTVTIGENGYLVRTGEKAVSTLARRRTESLSHGIGGTFRPAQGKTTHGLIVLVNFDDLKFNNTQAEIYEQMNTEGYSRNGATGSARDYFVAQSSGQFLPVFDVVGPVDLDMPYRYYGANDAKGSDKNAAVMIFSAVQKAVAGSLVNLDDYDADNDGIVDMVYIIYAGLGEADGGDPSTVWPHMWNLQASGMFANQYISGKRLGLYACSAEYRGDKTFSGIGTFCHEYGHCLGLPDIYDVGYNDGYGMASYDIMSSGAYLNNGNTPPNYSGFERYSVGWLMYDDVQTERDITLQPLAESNTAVRLSSPHNPDEYFVLENRQQEGWDAYLPARGLMITHIDYDEQVWDRNAVNADPDHQHVMMMAADNNWTKSTQSGDLYPGLLDNTSFSDTSKPNSVLWDGTPLGKPVSGISLSGSDVNFHVGITPSGISVVGEKTAHGEWHRYGTDGRPWDKSYGGIMIGNGMKQVK